MIIFTEVFVSQLQGKPVVDRREDRIGNVVDIIISPFEQFPRVIGLLVRFKKENKDAVVLIGSVDMMGRRFVSLKDFRERIVFTSVRPDEILLIRDIMDKQIVDVNGARVVRVNDLKLAMLNSEVRLICADVGLSGVLRRLKIDRIAEKILSFFRVKLSDSLIGWNYVESLSKDIRSLRIAVPHKRISDLHPSDIASILSQVHKEERMAIFESLTVDTAAEALHELEPMIQAYIIATIDTKKALNILEKMPPDEIADVLGDVAPEKADEFIRLMKKRKALEVSKLLKHDEATAGGLMTTDFVSLPSALTVEETINRLRESAPDAETIYYLYVVDLNDAIVGILTLRSLLTSQPSTMISDIMIKNIIAVSPEMKQRTVADIISKYNLLAVPVIDENKKILGIITVDDVIDFIIPPLSRRKRQMLG